MTIADFNAKLSDCASFLKEASVTFPKLIEGDRIMFAGLSMLPLSVFGNAQEMFAASVVSTLGEELGKDPRIIALNIKKGDTNS